MRLLAILLTAGLALALHLTLGWAWTLGAGLAGGFWAARRGWVVGGVGVGLAWAVLVAYNYAAAPEATGIMTDTVGGIIGGFSGNTASILIVALTLVIGTVLGALGGWVGGMAALLYRNDVTP
jgi:hypothetical protein